jgi:hypothetical protein
VYLRCTLCLKQGDKIFAPCFLEIALKLLLPGACPRSAMPLRDVQALVAEKNRDALKRNTRKQHFYCRVPGNSI